MQLSVHTNYEDLVYDFLLLHRPQVICHWLISILQMNHWLFIMFCWAKKRNKCVTSNLHLHVKQEHSESPTLPEGPDFTSLNHFELITNGMINNNLYSTIVTKTCMNFITRTKFVSSTQINLVFSIWLWLAQSTKGFNELVYIG